MALIVEGEKGGASFKRLYEKKTRPSTAVRNNTTGKEIVVYSPRVVH